MTGRELMRTMLEPGFPLDAKVYVGKGMGPAERIDVHTVETDEDGGHPYVVISP